MSLYQTMFDSDLEEALMSDDEGILSDVPGLNGDWKSDDSNNGSDTTNKDGHQAHGAIDCIEESESEDPSNAEEALQPAFSTVMQDVAADHQRSLVTIILKHVHCKNKIYITYLCTAQHTASAHVETKK